MKKWISFIALFFGLASFSFAQRFCYVDSQYILENLPEIQPHCGAIALKRPTLENVSFEKLQQAFLQRGQQRFYEVRIMLLQTHPQFKLFSDLFYMMQPEDNFEAEVEYLLNTYFLLGDATDTD